MLKKGKRQREKKEREILIEGDIMSQARNLELEKFSVDNLNMRLRP